MLQDGNQDRLNAQFFIRIGKDRYIPIEAPIPGKQMYIWDQKKNRIVPLDKIRSTL